MSIRSEPNDDYYRAEAKRLFHEEGYLEIDSNSLVSRAADNPDRGAYVQAWIWIGDPALGEDSMDDAARQF